jgi:hypothetical protein
MQAKNAPDSPRYVFFDFFGGLPEKPYLHEPVSFSNAACSSAGQ